MGSRCPFGKLPGKVGHQIPVLGIGGCRQPLFQIVCLVLWRIPITGKSAAGRSTGMEPGKETYLDVWRIPIRLKGT